MKFANNKYFNSDDLKKLGFNKVGQNCHISEQCVIAGEKNINLGNNIRIDSFVSIIAASGYLKIVNNVHIGSYCHLVCNGGIEIDSFAGLSQGVKLYSSSDDYSGKGLTNPTIPNQYKKVITKKIEIKKHTIIGSGSVILPGVTLAEGTSIGANSVIRKSTKEFTIYNGNPAKAVGPRSKYLLNLENKYKINLN